MKFQKSDQAPFIIHAYLEWMKEKIDECEIDPEKSYTTKVTRHISSSFWFSTLSSFRSIENKEVERLHENVL